jgi:predicted house-cleaning noncanonical NTP pyrophosphatase (MazG superfamily)
MMKHYKKLVRDKIPEIIRADGGKPITRVLSNEEHLSELVNKLKEEVAEFEADLSIEELADIQEVIIALLKELKIDKEKLEELRIKKAKERGGFSKRIFLDRVDE